MNPTIVHGAFAESASWNHVIDSLVSAGTSGSPRPTRCNFCRSGVDATSPSRRSAGHPSVRRMMVSYPYAWLPVVVVVGTVVLLTNAYLALIALMVLLPAVLAALAAAIVSVPYLLGRYASRRWREHADTRTPRAWSRKRQQAGAR